LRATKRPSSVSLALYTTPIPPPPSFSTMWYREMVWPITGANLTSVKWGKSMKAGEWVLVQEDCCWKIAITFIEASARDRGCRSRAQPSLNRKSVRDCEPRAPIKVIAETRVNPETDERAALRRTRRVLSHPDRRTIQFHCHQRASSFTVVAGRFDRIKDSACFHTSGSHSIWV